ncbi:MAG TPA: YqiJ family protein [Casimicrobium sp.]|nr:YqiJ family protein [Casimicrobium sp.]
MSTLTMPETWPFAAALALLVALAVIEGIGLMLSQSPSSVLDSLIPELPSSADGALGWLHLGKVPALVLLILFLAGFSITGYVIEGLAFKVLGVAVPAWMASIPAVFAGFATVSALGALLERVMPKDETSAVSELSLIGRAGIIVRGTATQSLAAEAKVRDAYGRAHYVLVEPDFADQSFAEGSDVLLVKKVGVRYRCIRNPHPELL